MSKPNSLPTRVKLHLQDHPASSDLDICRALNFPTDPLSLKAFRCCTRRLELAGLIKRDQETGAWSLVAFSRSKKSPAQSKVFNLFEKPRREIVPNKQWSPHHVRDALVEALFGKAVTA